MGTNWRNIRNRGGLPQSDEVVVYRQENCLQYGIWKNKMESFSQQQLKLLVSRLGHIGQAGRADQLNQSTVWQAGNNIFSRHKIHYSFILVVVNYICSHSCPADRSVAANLHF